MKAWKISTWGAALAILIAGCGEPAEKAVSVKGTVLNAGQPLEVAGRDVGIGVVQIAFHRVLDDGTISQDPEMASIDAQGRFEIKGRSGRGLEPGKYKVAIYQYDPYPQNEKLQGKFSPENTPLEYTIQEDRELAIDVSRPEGD